MIVCRLGYCKEIFFESFKAVCSTKMQMLINKLILIYVIIHHLYQACSDQPFSLLILPAEMVKYFIWYFLGKSLHIYVLFFLVIVWILFCLLITMYAFIYLCLWLKFFSWPRAFEEKYIKCIASFWLSPHGLWQKCDDSIVSVGFSVRLCALLVKQLPWSFVNNV